MEKLHNKFDERLVIWLSTRLSDWKTQLDSGRCFLKKLCEIERIYAESIQAMAVSLMPGTHLTDEGDATDKRLNFVAVNNCRRNMAKYYQKSAITHEAFSTFIQTESLVRMTDCYEVVLERLDRFSTQLRNLNDVVVATCRNLQQSKQEFEKNMKLYFSFNFVQTRSNLTKVPSSYFFSTAGSTGSSNNISCKIVPILQANTFVDPFVVYQDLFLHYRKYCISLSKYRTLLIESLFDWNSFEGVMTKEFLTIIEQVFLMKSKLQGPEQDFMDEFRDSLNENVELMQAQTPIIYDFLQTLDKDIQEAVLRDQEFLPKFEKPFQPRVAVPMDRETFDAPILELPRMEGPSIQERHLASQNNNLLPQHLMQDLSEYGTANVERDLGKSFKKYTDHLVFNVLSQLEQRQIALDGYVMLLTQRPIEAPVSHIVDFGAYFPLFQALPMVDILQHGLVFKQSASIFKGWKPYWLELTTTRYLQCMPLSWKDLTEAGLGSDGKPLSGARNESLQTSDGRRPRSGSTASLRPMDAGHEALARLVEMRKQQHQESNVGSMYTYALPLYSCSPLEIVVSPGELQFCLQYGSVTTRGDGESTVREGRHLVYLNGALAQMERKFTWKTVSEASMVDWTIILKDVLGLSKHIKTWLWERGERLASIMSQSNLKNDENDHEDDDKDGNNDNEDSGSWNVDEDAFNAESDREVERLRIKDEHGYYAEGHGEGEWPSRDIGYEESGGGHDLGTGGGGSGFYHSIPEMDDPWQQ